MGHLCDPFQDKRPDVLLSVVTRRESVSFYHQTLHLLTLNSSLCIKICQCIFIDPNPFQHVGISFFYPLPLFSTVVFSSNRFTAQVCMVSLHALASLPTQYEISFPLLCHLCTTLIMTDWWLPLQYFTVTINSLTLRPTNLQQLCLLLMISCLKSGWSGRFAWEYKRQCHLQTRCRYMREVGNILDRLPAHHVVDSQTNNRRAHNKQIPNREALAGNRNQEHIAVRQQHKQGEIEWKLHKHELM